MAYQPYCTTAAPTTLTYGNATFSNSTNTTGVTTWFNSNDWVNYRVEPVSGWYVSPEFWGSEDRPRRRRPRNPSDGIVSIETRVEVDHGERFQQQQIRHSRQHAAKERARELLLSFLNEEQRKSFEANGTFRVVSNKGNIFEITSRRMHNIYVLDLQGRRVHEWCVTLQYEDVPLCDVLLAQKMALEFDEDDLKKHSNITELSTGQMFYRAQNQFNFGQRAELILH